MSQKSASDFLSTELKTLCIPCGSLVSNPWSVKKQAPLLGAETDCSASFPPGLSEIVRIFANPLLCSWPPSFYEPSALSYACLLFHCSSWSLQPPEKSRSPLTLLILLPTSFLTPLHSHMTSDNLHIFLSSCLVFCASQEFCHIKFPSHREKSGPDTDSHPVYPRFSLFLHICSLLLVLFIFTPQLHPSFRTQTIANPFWHMMHSAAYTLPSSQTHIFFV